MNEIKQKILWFITKEAVDCALSVLREMGIGGGMRDGGLWIIFSIIAIILLALAIKIILTTDVKKLLFHVDFDVILDGRRRKIGFLSKEEKPQRKRLDSESKKLKTKKLERKKRKNK